MTVAQKMFVKAAPGRRVKDPYSLKLLAPEGEWKPVESYWLRRVLFGDCTESAPVVISETPAMEPKKPERIAEEPAPRPTKYSKKHESGDGHGENQ